MMSRKNYNALAAALASTRPRVKVSSDGRNTFFDGIHADHWSDDVDAIAEVLAADNPRFDRDRFRKACEEG